MACGSKRIHGVAVAVLLALTACAAPTRTADTRGLCMGFGFAAGTEALRSCIGQLDALMLSASDLRKQCEGVRQQALGAPARSSSFENTAVGANAAYQSCMSAQPSAMTQLHLPNGQAVTCRRVADPISCD